MKICFIVFLFSLTSCSRDDIQRNKWWSDEMTNKELIIEMLLEPFETRALRLDEWGQEKLGIMCNQVVELEKISKSQGRIVGVVLEQANTNLFLKTTYSSARDFDSNEEKQFIVKNESDISVEIIVYKLKKNPTRP